MSIESVYGSLLRRSPDEGAYGTYAGWSDEDIANAIYGSQEFADLQNQSQPQQQDQPQQQQQGGGGVNVDQINQLYQQYLGRSADQGGINTYMGMDYGQLANILNTSPERQNYLASQSQPQQQQQPQQQPLSTPPTQTQNDPQNLTGAVVRAYQQILGRDPSAQELAANVAGLQRDVNSYTWLTETLASSPEAAKFHAKDNTPALDIYGEQIVDTNGNPVSAYDPNAVANQVKAGYGNYVQTNNMSGIGKIGETLGNALPYAVAGSMLAGAGGALGGLGAAEGAAVPVSEITGSTFSGPAFTLPETAAATGTGLTAGSGYAGVGLNPAIQTGGELAYGGVGLNPAITGSAGVGLDATIPGITSGLATNAGALAAASGIPITADIFGASGGLTAAQSAALDAAITAGDYATASSLLPAGSTLAKLLAPAVKALGTATTANKAAQTSSLLPNLLRQGTSGGGSAQAALPGIYREPFNPFAFGNQQPTQGTVKGFDFLSALNKEGQQTPSAQSSAQPSSATARNQLLANLLF